ncbi:MAG: LPS export ABC transporter periplasmic protein LptC [Methanosarcina sp.]
MTNISRFHISIIVLILAFITLSCESKVDLIRKSDLLNYPSSSGKDIVTIMRDSGNIQLILKTPLIEQYNMGDTLSDTPYSEFRMGMRVDYFDGDTIPKVSVTSKYAKYTDKDKLWQCKDSVVVINENNEKLETELLYWDQKKDLIYTDRFVKITTEKSILQGIGFESDSHLNHRKIKNPSAEITIDDEESQ